MKSKHLLLMLLLALMVPWAAMAQETVEIGNPDATTTQYTMPVNMYYNYSLTQQIYTADEIGMAGTINSIAFDYTNSASFSMNAVQVYMMNVDKENFESTTDMVALGDATLVWEGTFSASGAGWVTIDLATPFAYDGTSNLLVCCYDPTNGYAGSSYKFRTTATETNLAIAYYSDSSVPSLNNVTSYSGSKYTYKYRNNIQLGISPAAQSDCEKPDALTAIDEPTAHEFSFEIEGGSGVYNIELKAGSGDFTPYGEPETLATTINLTNLEGNTAYQVRVQSVCYGSEGGDPGIIPDFGPRDTQYSGWMTLRFTTKNPCAAPTNLVVDNITNSSATLSWTPGYQETEWTVKYKKSTETEYTSTTVSGTPSINLTGLDGCTQYNVQIYNCESYLSGNFVTAAGIPFTESFATSSIPAGWSRYTGLLSDVMGGTALTTTTSGWNFGTSNGVFDNHARTNIYGTGCKYWLVTPSVPMENNVQLSFDLALTAYSGTLGAPATTGTDDKFVVLINDGHEWTILRQWDNAGSEYVYNNINSTAVGENVTIDLSSYAGQQIAIAFYGESTQSNADNNLHIDNVRIDYIPACSIPTGLAKANVTAHTVDLSWVSDGNVWNIGYKTADGEEQYVEVTDNPYTLTGLNAETNYEVRVQNKCSDNVYSIFTNSITFTTGIACPAPTGLAVALTPGNGSVATLNWTSDASEWVVAYKVATDTVFTEVPVSEKPYTFTGLTPETAYTAKVKAVCGGIDGESQWSSTTNFTPTNAYMITVNNGTNTNGYVPVYGYYVDNKSYSQFIIPASALADMQWGTINEMTFYSSNASVSWTNAKFEVYMTETNETTLSTLTDWSTMDKVMNEAHLEISGNQMVVTLDTPFEYLGGNLMVGVKQTVSGTYASASFYGVTATGASMGGYGTSVSQQNFLPKTTFAYEPGEAPACPKPLGLTVANVTAHEATITWTSDASAWQIQLGEETAIDVTEPTYTFTGLAPETPYSVKVRANCDGTYSDWTAPFSFTTGIACPVPTQILVSDITAYTAVVSWVSQAESFNLMLDTIVYENVTSPYELTDLNPETTYTVKVKAICGGEDGESQWSNGTSFKTAEICPEGMVCIGTGTSTNQYLPTYTFYNYSLTQQIYTAAEIGQSGEITSVGFYKSGTSSIARNLSIYLVSTEKETFSGSSDWIAVTASDLVYSGNVTFQNDAWTTIEFNTPFLYDGTTNIALIVDDNTGSYVSAPPFYAFNATSQAIYVYSDGTNYDATAPSSYSGTVLNVKNRVRLAIGEPPACPKPTGLTVNYTGGTEATISWTSDAEAWNMRVNGVEVNGVITNPYTLTGLDLATTYNVEVQANCGEDQSEWAGPVSFTTDLCLPENMCAITIALNDSYGDGWNGGQLSVVDVLTEDVLGTYTIENGSSATYTLALCEGRTINIVYTAGSYAYENGWVVTDINDEVISEHISGSSSNPPTTGIQATYTVNCTVITCKKPKDLAAFDIDKTSVVLSWTPGTEDQSAWRIAYMSENDSTYNYKNVTSNSYTLTGLTPETSYTVKVQANCGDGDYSNWSDEISFTTAEACPMTTIEGFAASFITTNQAVLNWASTYESYEVHYKVYGETEWSEELSTNSSSITLTGLTDGTEYEYQVRGLCLDVENAYTEWVDGINFTTASICGAPENLFVVPSTESATLTWTGYQNSYTVTCNGNVTNNVYGTTFNITGLEPSHTYTATVTGEGDCQVFETASIEFTTGIDWNNGSAWVGGEAPEQGGVGTVADSTIVVIPQDPDGGEVIIEFDNLSVGEGSYIVIEPGVELIFGGEEPIPVVISFDDEEEEPEPAKCREEQLPGGYKLIAPPTFLSPSELYLPVDTTHLMDNAVNDLYSFDVNYPAAEWRNYKLAENNFVNLNSGQGYLYYYETATGTWPGYAWPTAGASKEIALDYNAGHAYFPGANLIGNPFIVKGYPDKPFYVLNKEGNEVVADTTHYVKVGKGFFVLATEPGQTCTVSTTAPANVMSLNISLSQECSKIDAAAIRFNDTKTLEKFQLNPNHTKIYMPFEGKDYAILHGEALGEMPLNFEAEESGTYTLSFKHSEVTFSYLRLVDNLTGVETNLLVNPEYTFDARVNDYASRFRLVYATGSSIDGDNFSFINSNGNLCIYGIDGIATLQVMDVLGHIISSEKFSGSYEQKLNAAPGVYMLRLINGNDVKVQKIVVK